MVGSPTRLLLVPISIYGMKVADENAALAAAASKNSVTSQPGNTSSLKYVAGGEYFSAASNNVTAGMSLGYSTTMKVSSADHGSAYEQLDKGLKNMLIGEQFDYFTLLSCLSFM